MKAILNDQVGELRPTIEVVQADSLSKKHIRGSSLLLAGRVLSLVTNFAVQVLTVRYLSKSDYGAFSYAMSLASLGATAAVFGLNKTITRFAPIYQEREEYGKLFGSLIMMVSTILSLGFFLVAFVLGVQSWIVGTLVKDQTAVSLLLILVFLSPIDALDNWLLGTFAVFASPKSIFFRKHVLGPGLKLATVILLIAFHSNVYFLSVGYLAAGLFGVVLYAVLLLKHFRDSHLLQMFNVKNLLFPFKEIFGFSIPLLITDLAFLMRSSVVVLMLEYFGNVLDVAAFRAVISVARLNLVVIQSFNFLFVPLAARLFAKDDREGINALYWQSAIWIAVITFPIFIVSFSLAEPITLVLYGERYVQSAAIMAILSLGYYFNAALGFNADTLRVYGKIRYIVLIDFLAVLVSVAINLLFIPKYGAIGAAIGSAGTLIVHNLLNHVGLKYIAGLKLFQWQYVKVYLSITLGTVGLLILQQLYSLSIYVSLPIAMAISFLVFYINRNMLNLRETFPELMRFSLMRRLFTH